VGRGEWTSRGRISVHLARRGQGAHGFSPRSHESRAARRYLTRRLQALKQDLELLIFRPAPPPACVHHFKPLKLSTALITVQKDSSHHQSSPYKAALTRRETLFEKAERAHLAILEPWSGRVCKCAWKPSLAPRPAPTFRNGRDVIGGSVKEGRNDQLQTHRTGLPSASGCMACHSRVDPMGRVTWHRSFSDATPRHPCINESAIPIPDGVNPSTEGGDVGVGPIAEAEHLSVCKLGYRSRSARDARPVLAPPRQSVCPLASWLEFLSETVSLHKRRLRYRQCWPGIPGRATVSNLWAETEKRADH
jgi:hypothetical protein